MSALTKKQQKAQAFRSKQKAKKSGKPIPEDVPEADIDIDGDGDGDGEGENVGISKLGDDGTVIAEASSSSSGAANKKRKRSEGEDGGENQKSKEDLSAGAKGKAKAIGKGKGKWEDDDDEGEGSAKKKSKKEIKQRFILFIGNLGFKTTANDVLEHFKEPIGVTPQVRLLTSKPTRAGAPPKSRGIAFLEVPTGEAMQAALKLHHTTIASRRINVELTAGGGGKSDGRASKIKERNERVGVQRGKRAEKEREEAEKNGTLTPGQAEDNVNGFKPQGHGNARTAKGDGKEKIKTRGPEIGQKPMRAWGTAGAGAGAGAQAGAAPASASAPTPASSTPREPQDHSSVHGVSDGTVKVRGGRRIKVNPNGKPANNRPPRPRWEPTGPNATPVG